MKMKRLLTTLALVVVVIIAGCKKDTFKETVGVCPLVVTTDPLNLATGVPLNKIITATFNENMNSATITPTSFTIEAGAKGAALVAGAITYAGMTATFTPSSPLTANTTYTGTLKSTIKDLKGNSLQGNSSQADYVWTFTTGSIPTVSSTSPVNNETGVLFNKVITAVFSEAMDPLTLTTTTVTLANGATAVAGAVTYTGTTVSFTPTANLLPGTLYTATITTGAKNVPGIPLAANYVWKFTTSAIPTVILADPLNLATVVALNKVVRATFSEAMNPLTITGTSFTLLNGVTPVAGAVTYAGSIASFTPTVNLLPGILYTATITTGAKNVPGIPMAANFVWTFTTATAPTVSLTDPLNLATNVALNKVVSATFSEAMDPLTITGTSFTLFNGVTQVAGAVTYAGTIASFTPTVSLLAGTTYTATVTTVAKSVPGIPMASNFVWTFTTIPAFTLNVTAVNGTVVKNPSQLNYNSGTTVQLTATADPGYIFSSWSGDKVGVSSPTTILMNGNKNVTANFTLIAAVCPTVVPLGLSGNYVIFAESGISTTGTTSVIGDMGINPAAATAITGFALTLPAGGAFSSSSLVTGNIYAPGYAPPTPADLVTATTDMTTAYTTANGVAPTVPAELGGGTLSGNTLVAGVYKWGTNLNIATNITLDGGADNCATFIFQIAGDLTVANGVKITLQNGAQAKNIFWVVAGSTAALGTTVDFSGNILSKGLISLNTGAKVLGRLMSQTAVTLDAATVTFP
jgi:uncharacterized repeat protein (TIGR02543 family)